jgi:membrane protease YdiL (CAAX protease family)
VGGQGPLGGLGTFIAGVVFGAIRWRAGGIVGLIVVHGLIDLVTVEMAPDLTIQQLRQVHIVHPVLVILGYALMLAVLLYLWKKVATPSVSPPSTLPRNIAPGR